MANIKKILLAKKIGNTLYRVYPKTSADVVAYDETTTVAEKLADMATSLEALGAGNGSIQDMIDASCDALYNKIMGLTDSDTTINEAYDTLKEIADYLTEHGDVVTGFTNDIADLKASIESINKTIEALDYSKVTASTTNGNIVVDGQEVTVYTLPAINAADIVTDSDHQFVTADEKTKIASAAIIEATTTEPTDSTADDNTLYIIYTE